MVFVVFCDFTQIAVFVHTNPRNRNICRQKLPDSSSNGILHLEIATFVVKNSRVRRQMASSHKASKSPRSSSKIVKWRFSFPNHRNRRLTTKRSSKIAVFVVTQTLGIAAFVVRNRRIRRQESYSSSHKPPDLAVFAAKNRQGFVSVIVVTETPKSGPRAQGLGFRAWGSGRLN